MNEKKKETAKEKTIKKEQKSRFWSNENFAYEKSCSLNHKGSNRKGE